MRFACEPEERRVLVGGDPQPERHLLTVLFGRDACVVEAVEPLLRIAVLPQSSAVLDIEPGKR